MSPAERNREAVRRYRARHINDAAYVASRKAAQAKNYAKNRTARIGAALARAASQPLSIRDKDLQRKYGITLANFDAMLEAQAGLCGICTTPMKPGRATCVDHDHKTGRVRGLLCRTCNTRLGRLEADPLLTQASLSYAEAA